MRRPSVSTLLPAAALVMLAASACGKRADPLAPYVKTPQPPSSLEVAQIGNEVEVRILAPRTTTENRPLPVIELEWLTAEPTGPITKQLKVLEREEVAPGELRVKRLPIPAAPLRFTARAYSGKASSGLVAAQVYAPKPVPPPPTGLKATVQAEGVLLQWTNPPGAEPWPTPSPSPSASPSPSPMQLGQPPAPDASPTPTLAAPEASKEKPEAPPVLPAAPPAADSGTPLGPPPAEKPGAPPESSAMAPPGLGPTRLGGPPSPVPAPTPTPLPPTGIRIFRTDGAPRPAREPLQASSWLDTNVKPGDKPCYAISYATAFKPLVVSLQTEPVCVEIKDVLPPTAPTRLAADLAGTFIEVSWLASDSADVAFYRLYRAIGTGTREVALQTEGLMTRVQDPTMTSGPRVYEVVAVDTAGNESAASPPVRIVVP